MSYYRYTRLQQYINGQPTEVYAKGERADDVDYSTYEACMGSSADTRWVSIPQTVCYDGDLWSMEKEQISYDGGTSWSDTGNSRRASVIEQSSAQCFMIDWRVVPGEYICMMYAKWTKEAEYVSYDGGQTWTATGNIRRGETVIELLSADCGVIYQWIPTGEYICQGYNKYMKEKQVYSTDNGSTWTDTGNRRTGGLIEADSPYCGYEQYIYQWVDVAGEFYCDGYDKYTKQKEQRSSNNGQTWEDTGNTRAGEYIESLSTDCGVTYRWITVPNDYVCVGYDKYSKEKEQYSTNGSTWTDTGNTRTGSLIESHSDDCGTQYRWVTVQNDYVCVGHDKYNKEKEQYSTDGGSTWTDTGNTRAGSTLLETDSVDCGYPDYSTETLLEDYTDLNLYTPTKTDSGKHYIWKNNTYSLEGGQLLTFATDYYTYKTNLGLFDICNGTFTDNVLNDTDNGLNGKYYYYDGDDLCVSYLDNSLCVIKRYNDSETKILNTFLEQTLCMTAINKGFTIDSFYIKFYTIDWDNSSCTLTDTIDLHIYYPSSGSYEYIDNAYYQPLNRKIYGFRLMDYANQYYYWYFVIDVDTKQITKLKQYRTESVISTEQAGFNGLQIIHTNQDIDFYYYCGDVVIVNNGTKSKRYMTQNLYPYSFEDSVSTEKILSYQQYQSALLCSKAIARWITDPNDYACVVYDKYNKEKEQYSFDNGGTWVDTGKTRTGSTLIETNSEDCGYSPSYEDQYLTIEALESGSITFEHNGQFPIFRGISYSKNSEEWTSYTYGNSISVVTGDKIMWKATNNSGYYPSSGNESHFTSTAKYKLYGNPLSLYYLDNFMNVTTLQTDMFLRIFSGINLIDASNLALVATTLASGCYQEMFMNCTNLTAAPALPATTLATSCYKGMFYYCTSLTTAPALPATTLASNCYESMFEGCTSLTTAPSILPSITLPERCYFKMFYYCTSLTTAPTISATKLYTNCCNEMFRSCYSLTTAPTLSATKLSNQCYYMMFKGCRSLNSITCIATDRSATNCTYDWTDGVSSTGTFTKAAGVSWPSGDSGIPTGWTVVEAS